MSQSDINASPALDKARKNGTKRVSRGQPAPNWAALIVEGVEEVLFSVDRDWRFTYLNARAEAVLGHPREALLGQVLWDAFPTLIESSFEHFYRRVTEEGTPGRLEDFSPTTQGWYDVRAYPIPQGLIIYFQDITARKHAEAELQRQAERARVQAEISRALAEVTHDYQLTLETAAHHLADIVGDACIIRLVSEDGERFAFVAWHHRDPEAAALMGELLHKDHDQRATEGVARHVVQTGQPLLIPVVSPAKFKAMAPAPYGAYADRYVVTSALIVPLRTTGRVIGAIAMNRLAPGPAYTDDDLILVQDLADRVAIAITNARLLQQVQSELAERTRTEAALRESEQRLQQSQKMESVGHLAGGIAHDFNNLLTVITGYSELIVASLREKNQLYEDIIEIQRAGNRAAALTRQLLAFSRQQVLEVKVLNLNEVVADMDKLLHRTIGEDIELVSLLDPQLNPVLVDPGQLEQVILNLAVNARDAMPDGGQLTIETANVDLDEQYRSAGHPELKTGSYIMLAVSDTGTGMDQATQAQIFEPFFTTKELGKGTGLGLATVYGIVRQSEGYIWVYSEMGVGTTFKIYLPAVQALALGEQPIAVPDHAPPESPWREPAGGERTVVVVEDDGLVRELIHRVLIEAGYSMLSAQNGQEALELLAAHPGEIAMMLTDLVMPQMGGRELIDRLRLEWPSLKVLCMSGYTDRAVVRHGIIESCDGFLQKPFTPRTLLQRIDEVLRQEVRQ